MKIVISGTSGSGKSTIARIIRDALEDKGLKVELEDLPEDGYDESTILKKVEGIVSGMKFANKEVLIKTKTVRK